MRTDKLETIPDGVLGWLPWDKFPTCPYERTSWKLILRKADKREQGDSWRRTASAPTRGDVPPTESNPTVLYGLFFIGRQRAGLRGGLGSHAHAGAGPPTSAPTMERFYPDGFEVYRHREEDAGTTPAFGSGGRRSPCQTTLGQWRRDDGPGDGSEVDGGSFRSGSPTSHRTRWWCALGWARRSAPPAAMKDCASGPWNCCRPCWRVLAAFTAMAPLCRAVQHLRGGGRWPQLPDAECGGLTTSSRWIRRRRWTGRAVNLEVKEILSQTGAHTGRFFALTQRKRAVGVNGERTKKPPLFIGAGRR